LSNFDGKIKKIRKAKGKPVLNRTAGGDSKDFLICNFSLVSYPSSLNFAI
jgi:hypothetical protein